MPRRSHSSFSPAAPAAGSPSRLFGASHPAIPSDCITATIDGAARGNPGPASYGVVFEDGNGKVLAQLSAKLGRATNNVAEYRALLAALAYAREQGWRALRVRTDSELLANQVRGRFKVKNPDLKLLHAEAHRLAASLDFFSIEPVSRRYTRAADKLANAALDGRRASSLSRSSRAEPREAKPRDAADKLANPALHGRPERKREFSPRASARGPKTIRALYQDGVLKPLEPLDLPDSTEVELTLRRKEER